MLDLEGNKLEYLASEISQFYEQHTLFTYATIVICHFFIAEIFRTAVHRPKISYSKIFLIDKIVLVTPRECRSTITYSLLPDPRGALGLFPA